MKLNNFLQPKEQKYLLETVNEVNVSRNPKKLQLRGGFTKLKKSVAVVALVLIFGTTLGASALVSTADAEQAQAIDLLSPLVCTNQDSREAPYGGRSEATNRGFNNANGSLSVEENIINVSPGPQDDNGNPSQAWTALEEYGYFTPYYSNWVGSYPKDDETGYFAGTGGQGSDGFGGLISIEEPRNSPLFSPVPGSCLGAGGGFNSGFANAVAWLPKLAVAITGEVYQWASTATLTGDDSPLKPVAEGVEKVVVGDPATGTRGLKDVLFLDFLTPIILLAAIGLIWQGIIKRSSIQAAQSALWMVGAAIAGLLFLTAPLQIVKIIDNTVVAVTSGITDITLAGDETSDFCELPNGAEDKAVRQIKCSIWYTTIYAPWVKGQFGVEQSNVADSEWMFTDPALGPNSFYATDEPRGDGWTEEALSGTQRGDNARGVFANFNPRLGTEPTPASSKNWAYYQMHTQANREPGEGLNYSEIAYNQLVVNNNPIWKNADGAIGGAFLTLIASIGPVAVVGSISFTLIAYQITMLILIALSPLFLLVGVAPGWGRRIAMRWLEIIVGLLVKRIILTIFLVLFLKIYGIVLQAPIDGFFQTILVIVLSFAALVQRVKILEIFTGVINFGGDKRFGEDESVTRAMRNTGAAVTSKANQLGGRAAKGAVNSRVGRNIAGRADEAKSQIRDKVRGGANQKRDTKAGVGDPNNETSKTLLGVNSHRDLNMDSLDKKTKASLNNPDGTLNEDKANAYTEEKKKEYSSRNEDLAKQADKNRKSREDLRDIANRKERTRARARLREERKNIRVNQKDLNKEVNQTFKASAERNKDNTKKEEQKKK